MKVSILAAGDNRPTSRAWWRRCAWPVGETEDKGCVHGKATAHCGVRCRPVGFEEASQAALRGSVANVTSKTDRARPTCISGALYNIPARRENRSSPLARIGGAGRAQCGVCSLLNRAAISIPRFEFGLEAPKRRDADARWGQGVHPSNVRKFTVSRVCPRMFGCRAPP